MASFFKGIGSDLEKAAGYVGSVIHEGIDDVESFGKTAGHFVENATDQAFSTANHVISGGEDLGKDVIDSGKDVIQKGESIISLPLLIIAAGVAYFLVSENGKVAIQEGSKIAQQGMKNPELFM